MALPNIHTFGTFSRGKKTVAFGTVITQHVPPFRPTAGAPIGVGQTVSRGNVAPGITHVTDFVYDRGTTAHVITVMRPINYTTFAADAAAAQAAVVLTADPGALTTAGRYQYPLPNGQTVPAAAANLIGANDYVCYQAASGHWVVDTVASGSGTTPTLTTNLPTGGVKAGGLFYFFGITTDVDPATNEAHLQFDVLASSSGNERYAISSHNGLWSTLHPGDPLIFHSSNATATGYFELIAGCYSAH